MCVVKGLEKSHKTAYGSIRYWIYSHNPAKPWLVFLPGLTADHHLFDKQIETLSQIYNCFVWDAPAHGASRPFQLKFSTEDLAHYLYDIFEKETITSPILVGQSMGGYISQVYMELFPNSASAFISIDSCSLKRKYYSWWELALLKHTKWMYKMIPWKLLIQWGAWGTSLSEYGRKLMKETMQSYCKAEYCALADHGFRILANSVEAGRTYDIHCPALLLCGEKDGAGSAKRYNKEWTKQDYLPLIWLKNAGHNANTDVPEEVNEQIDHFVKMVYKENSSLEY